MGLHRISKDYSFGTCFRDLLHILITNGKIEEGEKEREGKREKKKRERTKKNKRAGHLGFQYFYV